MLETAQLTITLQRRYNYSRFHRITEISAICLFGVCAAGLAWKLAGTLDSAASWGALVVAVVLAPFAADFVSGFVHWMADRYGAETTPLLGNNFIRPFREHHANPDEISRHDFVETNGSNCIVAAPCMTIAFFALPASTDLFLSTFFLGSALAFGLTIFGTNQFHKWAHMNNVPRLARALQRAGVILGPEHHADHHVAPFGKNYCITGGWWNPVLSRLLFFERVEMLIELLTGARTAESRETPYGS